jgi:hypothetical protein
MSYAAGVIRFDWITRQPQAIPSGGFQHQSGEVESGSLTGGRIQMKVAFVNQPIDTILPPGQNSVGACTVHALRLRRR